MRLALDFLGYVFLTVVTLLPIINPLGTAVLLLGIGAHLEEEERNRQIRRACLYMTAILVAFLLLGSLIMKFFGISIPGLRMAGGLVIAFIGFKMLFPDAPALPDDAMAEAQAKADISFTPLAMPSLSGPGSIATVVSMSASIQQGSTGLREVIEYFGVTLGIVVSAVICFVMLRGATRLQRVLGSGGVGALSRVMGFLLICIGVQFVINGVRDLLADPAFLGVAGAPALFAPLGG